MGVKNTQFNTRSSWFSEYVSGKYVSYHSEQLTDATPTAIAPNGMTATGGLVGEWTAPTGEVYRSHVFTSSGTFEVTAAAPNAGSPTALDVFAVAGGGGGGNSAPDGGGGGGAGGLIEGTLPDFQTGPYPIVIGTGGVGGVNGVDTTLFGVTCTGGGAGQNGANGNPGGSSGGGGPTSPAGATGNQQPQTVAAPIAGSATALTGYGNGSSGPSPGNVAHGGGGAGSQGGPNADPSQSDSVDHTCGGDGRATTIIDGNPYIFAAGGAGGVSNGRLLLGGNGGGGGGGGGASPNPPASDGGGGGAGGSGGLFQGQGGKDQSNGGWGGYAAMSSGSGGGGACANPAQNASGGTGGPGIAVFRYQIGVARLQAASGGSVSFWDNPSSPTGSTTIHTFFHSGTFATPGTFSKTVEYVVIGGGGAGGDVSGNANSGGGGGGAGGYLTGSTPVGGPATLTVTVGRGGYTWDDDWWGQDGEDSVVNFPAGTVTADGGGGGAGAASPAAGRAGGSGGGSSQGQAAGAATNYPGPTQQGYPGGNTGVGSGNGGGGAGQVGQNGLPGSGNGGTGGHGLQLPATFRAPMMAPTPSPAPSPLDGGGLGCITGPSPGGYWIAGGGGGGTDSPGSQPDGGRGGGGMGGNDNDYGRDGLANTGGGGGGGYGSPAAWSNPNQRSGRGGTGIVLIAYPT